MAAVSTEWLAAGKRWNGTFGSFGSESGLGPDGAESAGKRRLDEIRENGGNGQFGVLSSGSPFHLSRTCADLVTGSYWENYREAVKKTLETMTWDCLLEPCNGQAGVIERSA
jgi:hypothetical protein